MAFPSLTKWAAKRNSPLMNIPMSPDELIVQAYNLLQVAEGAKEAQDWSKVSACSQLAAAKAEVANYLRDFHPEHQASRPAAT